jgi:hypothetical protein
MPETSDYTPAPWAGDSFASARDTYDVHVGRSYDDARTKGLKASDLLPDKISTDARAPIVVLCDETGSMGDWPATIFSKLPYLDHEARFYFGEDYAIAFGAFGDANCREPEEFPVQLRPFAKDKELQDRLKELIIEGGGGGQVMETSELAALYVDQNVSVPNAVRPILIIITDEKSYDTISPETAKQWAKVDLKERLTTRALFESLKNKWSVYLIRKPYNSGSSDSETSTDRGIREHWEELLGSDHIAFLPDASRVVDVIFGIFAQETGKVEEFRQELMDRQLKDVGGDKKVEIALKALVTIHRDADAEPKLLPAPSLKKLPGPDDAQHSMTRRNPGDKTRRSKSLLGDDDDDK